MFPDKPPLIYWLMMFFMSSFGRTNSCALCIRACHCASAFLIFLIASRLFDRRAGLWSMLVFASSTLTIYLGITAMAMPFWFVSSACTVGFRCDHAEREGFWGKAAIFLVAMSLSL